MLTMEDYTMYVHPSFRISMSGNFTSILKLLKMMGQEEYDSKVAELVESISQGSNLKYMGGSKNEKMKSGLYL